MLVKDGGDSFPHPAGLQQDGAFLLPHGIPRLRLRGGVKAPLAEPKLTGFSRGRSKCFVSFLRD